MRSIERAAALITVLGMPVIAYGLALMAVSMWEAMDSTTLADAGLALEDGLALLAAAIGASIAGYLALTGYAMLLGAAWRGGRAIPKALAAIAPHGWTRVTAAALGLTISAGLAAPALAAEAGSIQAPSAGWVAAPVSVPTDTATQGVGWVPEAVPPAPVGWATPEPSDAAVDIVVADVAAGDIVVADVGVPDVATAEAAVPDVAETATPVADVAREGFAKAPGDYVVQPGDSLWRITEKLLGPDATESEVAALWPQLYAANRVHIGDNPSLIQPGLTLTIPVGLDA